MNGGLQPLNKNDRLALLLKYNACAAYLIAAQAFHFRYLVFNALSNAAWEALKLILRT